MDGGGNTARTLLYDSNVVIDNKLAIGNYSWRFDDNSRVVEYNHMPYRFIFIYSEKKMRKEGSDSPKKNEKNKINRKVIWCWRFIMVKGDSGTK
jgi:hypothetical protein